MCTLQGLVLLSRAPVDPVKGPGPCKRLFFLLRREERFSSSSILASKARLFDGVRWVGVDKEGK